MALSTVPSSRPVSCSTTRTGAPPVPRRSASAVARSRRVQYHPVGRRRSSPRSTRSSRTSCIADAEDRLVVLRQRQLGGGGAQVRAQDVRVGRVEHRRLDRTAEQRGGVVDEVGVQGVVAGDQHGERALTGPPGPAGLLPHRGDGAGEPGDQDGVEAGDVDARARAPGWRPRPAAGRTAAPSRARDAPPAGSRRGRPRPARPGTASTSPSSRLVVAAMASTPRRDRTKAMVRTPPTTRSASRSAVSAVALRRTGAPFSPTNRSCSGGSTRANARAPRGDPSSVTAVIGTPVSRLAETAGSLDGRRGEHEHRRRSRTSRTAGAAGAAPGRRASRTPRGSRGTRR